ncbi:MAG: hypothetical protein KIH63_000595 [Candidatus Saccharibacteria bacterium]|nr:hypothetical protein [Candidatus Saccharibacteria bacterium]
MSDLPIRISELLPAFERSTYDSLLPRATVLCGEELDAFRRATASTRVCTAIAPLGMAFLQKEGYQVISEWHIPNHPLTQGGRLGHMFISELGDPNRRRLGEHDVVIDPTYLQFAHADARTHDLPSVFVGPRGEIMQMMSDPDFSINPVAAQFYTEDTWVPAKSF